VPAASASTIVTTDQAVTATVAAFGGSFQPVLTIYTIIDIATEIIAAGRGS
jgi:hypothetical protein